MDPWITPDQIPRYDEFSGKLDLPEICAGTSEILYMLSGRQYGIGTATVRPAALDHNCGCLPWWAAAASGSAWGTYTWPWGRWFPEGWGCGCASAKEIVLRGRNIRNLTVMSDGDLLVAGSDYRVFSGRRVIRTDGHSWSCCQRLDQDDTQPGTTSMKYTWGTAPPAAGRIAARALSGELAAALLGTDTKLPGRVTSLSRGGITAVVQEPTACLEKGFTGVSAVDTFLLAVNPMQARRQAQFVSPDSRLNFRQAPVPSP